MDNGKIKNQLWFLIIVMAVVISLLSGCSSSPKIADAGNQYCYNNKKIIVKNGQDVTSESITTCSDDNIGKLVDVRAGLAKNCNYAKMNIRRGNEYVPRKVVICKDHDGDSHVLFSSVVN